MPRTVGDGGTVPAANRPAAPRGPDCEPAARSAPPAPSQTPVQSSWFWSVGNVVCAPSCPPLLRSLVRPLPVVAGYRRLCRRRPPALRAGFSPPSSACGRLGREILVARGLGLSCETQSGRAPARLRRFGVPRPSRLRRRGGRGEAAPAAPAGAEQARRLGSRPPRGAGREVRAVGLPRARRPGRDGRRRRLRHRGPVVLRHGNALIPFACLRAAYERLGAVERAELGAMTGGRTFGASRLGVVRWGWA